jgi:hypothetical protein
MDRGGAERVFVHAAQVRLHLDAQRPQALSRFVAGDAEPLGQLVHTYLSHETSI